MRLGLVLPLCKLYKEIFEISTSRTISQNTITSRHKLCYIATSMPDVILFIHIFYISYSHNVLCNPTHVYLEVSPMLGNGEEATAH